MQTKFYEALNSNRAIRAGDFNFTFEPYRCFGGTWYGLLATDKEDEQTALATLTTNPGSAVTEISEADFLAKKNPAAIPLSLQNSKPLPVASQKADLALTGTGAQVVENPTGSEGAEELVVAEGTPLDSASDALDVGSVNTGVKADAPVEEAQPAEPAPQQQ